ncbi:uncharacterized protein A1O9_12500, partial [Exophiala aquamarina CBS 119918]
MSIRITDKPQPGVACDIPSHSYQFTFEPNTQWSKFFSGGEEILQYVRGVADKYGITNKVEFQTRVAGAEWNEEEGEWVVKVVKGAQSERRVFDVVVNATGCLNNCKWPDIEGLQDFEDSYSPEELKQSHEDQAHYWRYRKEIERSVNLDHACLFPNTPSALITKERIVENMKRKLAKKPELYGLLVPGFVQDAGDSRPDAIITEDGKSRPVDGIVYATGFETSFIPRFPVFGQNGTTLANQWKKYSSAYLSLAQPNFPNYFTVGGPNSATSGGSLLIIFESVIGYIVKAVQKIAREHIKCMVVKQHSLNEWEEYVDAYFPGTVHIEECPSWYKAGETNHRVVGLWPGSSLHARKTLETPRWEDF